MVALLVKAVVGSLKAFPVVNSSLDGDDLVLKRYYNIGFAADTPNGLVVPVIKDADSQGHPRDRPGPDRAVGQGARRQARRRDMQGATFTISSLGGIGGTGFTPIINAPEVAILGVTRSAMKPVWDGSQFMPRLMVPLSLSYDHRVIDGALAARFVAHLVDPALRPATGAALMVVPAMEVKVPDIGDFTDVPVIEVLVGPGDEVRRRIRWSCSSPTRRRWTSPRPPPARSLRSSQGRRHGLRGVAAADARAGRLRGRRRSRPSRRRPAPADARRARAAGRRRQRPGRRARRRPGRLHGGVPRRRPRPDRRADRPRRAARRRLPERRLHPVEGAAARREGPDRGRRDRRGRHHVRPPEDRHRQAARVEGRRRRAPDRRARVAGQAAQGPGRARHGHVHRPQHDRRQPVGAGEPGELAPRRGERRRASPRPSSASSTASSPPAPRRRRCRSCPTTRGSWTPRARSRSKRSPSGCWSSAAASSGSRWRRSTTPSARRSRSSSCSTSSSRAATRTS